MPGKEVSGGIGVSVPIVDTSDFIVSVIVRLLNLSCLTRFGIVEG